MEEHKYKQGEYITHLPGQQTNNLLSQQDDAKNKPQKTNQFEQHIAPHYCC
jgi:hypothetical protein